MSEATADEAPEAAEQRTPGGNTPYDFRRPTTLAREHARVLDAALDVFNRQWGTNLGTRFRAKIAVSTDSIELMSYAAYAGSLPHQTVMVMCKLGELDAMMVVQIPNGGAYHWVSRIMGGLVNLEAPLDENALKFTGIDTDIISSIVETLLADLGYALANRLKDTPVIDQVHFNSQFTPAALPGDLMVVVTLRVESSDLGSPKITVAIPSEAILPHMDNINRRDTAEEMGANLPAAMMHVPLSAQLQLDPFTVTPGEVLAWKVGTLVRSNHARQDPLLVRVGNQSFATAIEGKRGRHQTMKIVSTTQES